jgi:enolase-phosphatase E1
VLWSVLYDAARRDELSLALPLDAAEVRALLLDIEGTTTPIDFVFRTLFPFASNRSEDFLRRHFQEADIRALLDQLFAAREGEAAADAPVWVRQTDEENLAGAAAYLRWLIAMDSKITPLKTLEGKIWEEGFLNGELKGEVYPDVAPAFARWKSQGRRIAIFSSGSILAQQLLFAHSTLGDLSPYLQAYFDTSTGPKRDRRSYQKIADSLKLAPARILFVSDVGDELDAAQAAGMSVALSLRPQVTRPSDPPYVAVRSFVEIFP